MMYIYAIAIFENPEAVGTEAGAVLSQRGCESTPQAVGLYALPEKPSSSK